MAQSKTSKSNEAYFTRYKTQGIYAKNRRKRLERAQKEQPNNSQIATALKELGSYRRGTPKVSKWNATSIAQVMLAKLFKVPDQPVSSKKTHAFPKKLRSDFSIASRAHDKQGNLVWAS